MSDIPGRKGRGPDKKPRKPRKRKRVERPRIPVDGSGSERFTEAQLQNGRDPSLLERRPTMRLAIVNLDVPLVRAFDEMVVTFDTSAKWVLKHAVTWVVCTYAPEIAEKHGIRLPPPTPFSELPPPRARSTGNIPEVAYNSPPEPLPDYHGNGATFSGTEPPANNLPAGAIRPSGARL